MKDSVTTVAYIAGLVDGEGYIGIKKSGPYPSQQRQTPGFHARIQIRMVHKEAIALIASRLGGRYYKEKPHAAKGRPLFCYQASDLTAELILRKILPYLLVKKDSARTVLALRDLQSQGARHRTKVIGLRRFPNKYGVVRMVESRCFSDAYVRMCEELYQKCKALNGRC